MERGKEPYPRIVSYRRIARAAAQVSRRTFRTGRGTSVRG
jgi:hypothetical protein